MSEYDCGWGTFVSKPSPVVKSTSGRVLAVVRLPVVVFGRRNSKRSVRFSPTPELFTDALERRLNACR